MCENASWKEKNGEVLFLDDDDLKSKRGLELKAYLGTQFDEDKIGHGAIEWFYNITGGTNKECTDFSTPDNFPPKLVAKIKSGKRTLFGVCEGILTAKALAEYKKVKGTALAEYEKVKGTALAEYEKVKGPALAEYKKVKGQAWAEYEKVKGTAWAEYKKVKGTALAEYEKVEGPAWAEYEKVEGPAWAEYEKVEGTAFWQIALIKNNRVKAWR